MSGVYLRWVSAELVGCHSRPPEWPHIAKDNDCHGYVKGACVFVPGRSLKSNKPLSVCQARSHRGLLITVRQFGEVSMKAPVIAFYNYCRGIRQRSEVTKCGCNSLVRSWIHIKICFLFTSCSLVKPFWCSAVQCSRQSSVGKAWLFIW